MKDDKVIISLEKVPIRRALKRAKKKLLLLLLVIGFLGGYVYSAYIRTPAQETTSTQQ
jgi:hypothetical protein